MRIGGLAHKKINHKVSILLLAIIVGGVTINSQMVQNANAVLGGGGNQCLVNDPRCVFMVPVSWCSLIGSPSSPTNNTPDTDRILFDRLTRASGNVLSHMPAGIILRTVLSGSGLSLSIGHFSINLNPLTSSPIIPDSDTTIATQGDVLDPDIGRAEFDSLFLRCERAYSGQVRLGLFSFSIPIHSGLTAVNINQFHNNMGAYINPNGGTTLGYASCDVAAGGICYGGNFAVIDNRTILRADPLNVVLAHEATHALSPGHTGGNNLLMNHFVVDNNMDGFWDNRDINTDQATLMRRTANSAVTGVIRDPPNKLIPTDILGTYVIADVQDEKSSNYLDLSKIKVMLNATDNKVSFGNQVFGLIPNQTKIVRYWTLVDTDNDRNTGGAAEKTVQEIIGLPSATTFNGADLVIKSEVNGFDNVTSSAWKFQDGKFVQLPDKQLDSLIMRNMASPVYERAPDRPAPPPPSPVPIHDTVTVIMNNTLANLTMGRQFNIQSIITNDSQASPSIADKLDNNAEETGVGLVLFQPQFPHCFPQAGEIKAGETVPIELQGLTNNSKITGLLGLNPVFKGFTNSSGGGTITFPVPANTTKGFHQVTIVVDDSAIAAVCGVNVNTLLPTANSQNQTHNTNIAFR